MTKTKLTWINIQTKLKKLSQRDLIALTKEIYALDKEVRDFLHAKFYNDTNIIDSYKQKIEKYLTPHPTHWNPPQIAKAKKAIQDYKKATNNQQGILELMVYYYSLLTKFMFDYGPDIYVDDPAEVSFTSIIDILQFQENDTIYHYLPQIILLRKKWEYAAKAESIITLKAPALASFLSIPTKDIRT